MNNTGGNLGAGGGPGTGRNGKHPRGNRGGGRGHNTRGRGGGGGNGRGGHHGAAGSERKASDVGSVNSVDFPGLMDATNTGPSHARGSGNGRNLKRGRGQVRGASHQPASGRGENDKRKTATTSSGTGSEDDGNENNVATRKFQKRERKFDGPVFGFKRLYRFLEMDSGEVLISINKDKDDWKLLLESEDLIAEKLILVIEVLAKKVCEETPVLLQQQTNIMTACCNEVFVNKLVDALPKICNGVYLPRRHNPNNEYPVDCTPSYIVDNVYQICSFIITTLPSNARDFLQSLIFIAMSASDKFKTLNDQIKDLAEKKRKEEERDNRRRNFGFNEEDLQEFDSENPPDSIKDIEIIPKIEELRLISEPFLRPNKKSGAYNDSDHYLDVQFRLLREDFVRPLRNGIRTFLKEKHEYITGKKRMPLGEVRLYTDVTIDRVVKERDSVVYKLRLSPRNYKRIKWERSKRLLVGSLIILTTNEECFQSDNTHFGIIFSRNPKELEKGILSVTWEGSPPQQAYDDEVYIMFESEVYLEAYRHTLETMKSLELSNFPMKKFIVDACGTVDSPKYLKEATKLIQLKLKNGEDVYLSPQQWQWPSAEEFGLDENQLTAFQAAITKEFSIIQGPPGTGKTFLGLKVAEVLLNNSELWKGRHGIGNPITVVCYTNHALDQFLEGILAYYKRSHAPAEIIRIGGRCKSESLAKYSLRDVRYRHRKKLPSHYFAAEKRVRETIYDLESERASRMSEITGLLDLQGIVDFEKLSAWRIIQVEYPKKLWDCFQRLSWLGIGNEYMKSGKFLDEDVAAQIREWFHVRRYPNTAYNKVKRTTVADSNSNNGATETLKADEDDEEDYDLEELLEHRIVDDILLEAETSHQVNMGRRIAYLPESSIGSCDRSYQYMNKMILEATREMNPAQANDFRQSKRPDQLKLENRRKFLHEILGLYKEQLLDLPDVTDILQEIRQGGSVLNHLPRLKMSERWALYFAMVDQIRLRIAEKVAEVEKQLSMSQRELRQTIQWGDGLILQHCKVVGLTTTGAAKYNNLLKMMKSKIVIVEEAAEVFEAHIVTCITENCEQLILIGDHRQLRPSPTVYTLATKYHLDLSLFERMLNNKLHCHQLKMQHRMRPDISDLVIGPIYDELYNHDSVKLYPDVNGIPKNVFFITHTEKETADTDSTSKSNKHEAKFIAALCRYLILQGYKSEQITVLTMYTGQMFLLKKEMLDTCKGVRVTCVDNFQGEENDIILLSLVRSNSEGKIGFLKIDNRICVSLSRAKHGLYVIGNMDGMVDNSKTWRLIKDKLDAQDGIGESLELQCQNHFTRTQVRNHEEFKDRAPEGGCTLPCDTILDCTHKCKMVCHIIDKNHEKYKCMEKCLKKCGNDLHLCRGACFQSCPACIIQVEKTLKCELEHKMILPCHKSVDGVTCREMVEKTLPCGHQEELACFVSVHEYACKVKVEKSLPCGHKKKMECNSDPAMVRCRVYVENVLPCDHLQMDECWRWLNPETIKCEHIIEKKFEKCGHELPVKCGEKNLSLVCKGKCTTRLPCGHQCVKTCHLDDDPEHSLYICRKDCGRECKDGHKCASRHHCSKKCPPCTEEVLRILPCGHKQKLACHVDIDAYECLQECQRLLTTDPLCRHKCPNLCFQPCGPCTAIVKKRAPCGHPQIVLCSELAKKEDCEELVPPGSVPTCGHTNTLVPCKHSEKSSEEIVKYCQAPCDHTFSPASSGGCGHKCLGKCCSCCSGRIHMKCQNACGKQLVCGHVCEVPCSAVCPPCQKPCMMKCEHSACKMKCGEPCSDCKEPCGWVCSHKKCSQLCGDMCNRDPCNEPCRKKLECGHECVGFCGEPCPPLCRICNREELTTILFGNEDEDDARFVYLEDCNHTIEVKGLEEWIATSSADGTISAKKCPLCKATIRNCRRFGNLIRQHYKDVVTVKMRAYGNKANTERLQNMWVTRLNSGIQMERIFPKVHEEIRNYLVTEVPLRHGTQLKKKKISEFAMRSLDFVADSANKTANNLSELKREKLVGQHYDRVLDIYRKTFASIMERHPLSTQEVSDFNEELDRLDYFTQLMIRRSLSSCNPDNSRAYPTYELAKSIVTSSLPFTTGQRQLFKRLLGELDELLKSGLGISDRERIIILRAMGEAQGHWFKCPNGHIYVISDCGGATVESRCGECNARIGGASHRLRSDNALATEMDGATRAAWPTAIQ